MLLFQATTQCSVSPYNVSSVFFRWGYSQTLTLSRTIVLQTPTPVSQLRVRSGTPPSLSSHSGPKPIFVQSFRRVCVSVCTHFNQASPLLGDKLACQTRHQSGALRLTDATHGTTDGISQDRRMIQKMIHVPVSCVDLQQPHGCWQECMLKRKQTRRKKRGEGWHLAHPCAHSSTRTPQRSSAIAGTEPCDSVCSAGSLLSRCRFPWIDFSREEGKIQV